jgi:hypothetical protein
MVLAIFEIYLFIGIRLILQAWVPRGLKSIKKYRVILGIIWIPLESITYLNEIITYVPGTFCCPPMPSEIFLAWLVFVVVDILYQFHVITKMSE